MADRIALARQVFGAFQASYEKYCDQPHVHWWLNLLEPDDDDMKLALSADQIGTGISVLRQKGLIKLRTSSMQELTDLGREVCLHPETLDRYLAPQVPDPPIQNVTFNAQQMQNVQTGHGSVINVTYSQVLQQLANDVAASSAPAAEKSDLLAMINAIASHPITQTALTLAGGALLPK